MVTERLLGAGMRRRTFSGEYQSFAQANLQSTGELARVDSGAARCQFDCTRLAAVCGTRVGQAEVLERGRAT